VAQHLEVFQGDLSPLRAQFGGMNSDDAKRLVEMDAENARIKRKVGERSW
jgi:hypothetical protein